MNIYFSGIGGVGIGPLAEIALDAGYRVQGSDAAESMITEALRKRDIRISFKQDGTFLQECYTTSPIDWFVYTAALPDGHPELVLARQLGIKTAKRDELLAHIIKEKNLHLIAIAGTHGKTTTTGMMVWAFQQLGVPVSYSVGTTLSFGPSGKFDPESKYFVYECDEYDRNFLHFHPLVSLITSLDYDHPDTYPTEASYIEAFALFTQQSDVTVMWQHDNTEIQVPSEEGWLLKNDEVQPVTLPGEHNRRNATLVIKTLEYLQLASHEEAIKALSSFPGTSRRFERLADNLYSDYGHHPAEIAATLQMARELSDHVVLVYQPHQNVRQHEIRNHYTNCFEQAEQIYWLPTYLSREDPKLPILTPSELSAGVTNKESVSFADLDDDLWDSIQKARDEGKLVVCMGAGSIDGWIREQIQMRVAAGVLLIGPDGEFILQQRDHTPGIRYPGKIGCFGGAGEPEDRSLRETALRELKEETNLAPTPDELTYFKTFSRSIKKYGEDYYATIYLLPVPDPDTLEVYEGQGYIKINASANLKDFPLTEATHEILSAYRKANNS